MFNFLFKGFRIGYRFLINNTGLGVKARGVNAAQVLARFLFFSFRRFCAAVVSESKGTNT